ncbi:MAG: hypothetical protein JSV88_18075 [Candidatus Aminicenantes bacterium]|nr:MAG: hypothetical protein JSV88_18075 [Candidatus Aminicenantes bacterium]
MLNKSNPAVIFGLNETGLAIGRSLGRHGIKVYGISHSKGIAYYSKYINGQVFPHPIYQESEFIKKIDKFCQEFQKKPILFIDSDEYLMFYAKNSSFIDKHFLSNLPDAELVKSILDKYTQYKLAIHSDINVPKTIFVDNVERINEIKKDLEYPVFVKARDVNIWRKMVSGTKKGFIINDKNELIEKLKSLDKNNVPVIIQEIVKSPDNQNYKICVYISSAGDYKLVFTLRKIHQYPIHFGIGSSVMSYKYPLLVETGLKLFSSIGYRGVGSAEFKYDEKDSKLKLIEINPRYWQQNSLADFCGMNFPLMDYQEAAGQSPGKIEFFRENLKWVNLYLDFTSYLEYKKEGEITFSKWLRDLKGEKTISYLSWDDITPLFLRLFRISIRRVMYFKKKLFK